MLLLRLDTAAAMVVMVATVAAMVATEVTAAATARGLLMLMPLLRLATAAAMVAMVATAVAMAATERGLLSPAMAMAATGVSYHRIRRSELSQKQNHKNSQC